MIRQKIISLIDFFYPLFKRLMPINTFRYLACGAVNFALDIGLFFVFYNFVYHKQVFHLKLFSFQPHIAAFISSFFITFPVGFLLSRYIVFTSSLVKGHVQLFRYLMIVIMNFLLTYVFLKLFVEYFHFYATISKTLTTIIVIIFGYLGQKHFAFKVKSLNY
jgi:putative flippase GtrA